MPLPELTHLQFAVLGALAGGERPGRVVRELLADDGIDKAGPAFYQLMARLEDGKLVEGWYVRREAVGQTVRERTYRITGAGAAAWESARDFYRSHGRDGLKPGA